MVVVTVKYKLVKKFISARYFSNKTNNFLNRELNEF